MLKIARFFLPLVLKVILNLAAPRWRWKRIVGQGEAVLQSVRARKDQISGDRWEQLAQAAGLLPGVSDTTFRPTLILFISGVAAGMASWNFLRLLAAQAEPVREDSPPKSHSDLLMQVTRGMPHNPTTEMDLALWEIAQAIHRDPDASAAFQEYPPTVLSGRFLAGELPSTAAKPIRQFLTRYGGRGLAEIDLGRPRWAEDPTYIFETLNSYLKIEAESQAPDVVFARGAAAAQHAVDQLSQIVKGSPGGGIKSRLVRFFAGRARQLMGMRESPKFFAVRLFWLVREALLDVGQLFVDAGELDDPEDLFYLTFSELQSFAAKDSNDWREMIADRRSRYRREVLRTQVPRVLLSDGRAFYEGLSADIVAEDNLMGSPVSPGSVEGLVRVVFDPTQAGLIPGEILVCPGTDPSWTPLFLSAAGLVMEVGGMMTHGAVVAREYGIPAVVGVDKATQRLHTGQRVRMDGSSGQIEILEG
jgi:pyruvate,water dikinase